MTTLIVVIGVAIAIVMIVAPFYVEHEACKQPLEMKVERLSCGWQPQVWAKGKCVAIGITQQNQKDAILMAKEMQYEKTHR